MNKIFTSKANTVDCRFCLATVAGIYSPLILLLAAAALAF